MSIVIEEIVFNPLIQVNETIDEVVIEVAAMQMPATKESIGLGNVDNTSDLNKPISTAVSLALNSKLNIVDYNDRFKGVFLTLESLNLALPTANAGDSAQVNEVGATDVINYSWDAEENIWVQSGASGSGASNTDALPEGTSNLYFTTARVLSTFINGVSFLIGTPIVSTDTILQAFGKLQKQISDNLSAIGLKANDNSVVHLNGDETISGIKTFTPDILVNGLTVGKGNNGVSTNTVLGVDAGKSITTGNTNTFIGNLAGNKITNNNGNTFVGSGAGRNSLEVYENSFFGNLSGTNNTTGVRNTIIGALAGLNSTTGSSNLFIGGSSGRSLSSGSLATIINNSLMIGYDTRPLNNSETNQIVIGHQAVGLGSNTSVIGNSSTIITGLWGDLLLLRGMATAPLSATDTGTLGAIRVTATHIYVCTATNTWVRTALTTW